MNMDLENYSFCGVCSKHFTGRDNYFQHIKSEKHRRKVEFSQRFEQYSSSSNSNVTVTEVQLNVKQGLPMVNLPSCFFCEICKVYMSGPESYDAHMDGAPHAKKVKNLQYQKNFDSTLFDSEEKSGSSLCNLETAISTESCTSNINLKIDLVKQDMQSMSMQNRYFCKVCETSMTGPESYASHMKGAPHAKKVKNLSLQQQNFGNVSVEAASNLSKERIVKTSADDSHSFFLKKNLKRRSEEKENTIAKYQVLEEKYPSTFKVNSEFGPDSISSNSFHSSTNNISTSGTVASTSNFFCDVCLVNVCGKGNFDQHLRGASHHKKLQNKTPQVKINISQSLESDAPVFKDNYVAPLIPVITSNIFCNVCNVSVCGQENFNQHLKGAQHAKMERQKKRIEGSEIANSEVSVVEGSEIANSEASVVMSDFNGSNLSDENEGEKNIEVLKERIKDVLMCYHCQDPKEVILGKW